MQDPEIVRSEIQRRLAVLQEANPTRRRKESLSKERTRLQNSIAKLLDAYQEGLLSLDELRTRMPALRQREAALKAELASLEAAATDQQTYLRLADTIEHFLARLRHSATTLAVSERQQVLRLVVKEILVDQDTITLRHSIPVARSYPLSEPSKTAENPSYLLRPGRRLSDSC